VCERGTNKDQSSRANEMNEAISKDNTMVLYASGWKRSDILTHTPNETVIARNPDILCRDDDAISRDNTRVLIWIRLGTMNRAPAVNIKCAVGSPDPTAARILLKVCGVEPPIQGCSKSLRTMTGSFSRNI
jgi:hypothetical protein